jgi:hypothetical protein
MKKKILSLIASLILTLSASYARSNDGKIPQNVSSVFSNDFSHARNINWEMYRGCYKASFVDMGMTLYAFYTPDAEFMGIAGNLAADKLPVSLQTTLKEKYPAYWITELYQFTINTTPGYLITIENADRKVMLKAEANKSWSFYAEVKKN